MTTSLTREQFLHFIKKDKDIEGCISRTTRHYARYFHRYKETGQIGGWNWVSGLFFPFWVFYRGILGWFLLGGLMIFNFLVKKFFLGSQASISIVFLLVILILMRYRDYIYMKSVEREVLKGVLRKKPNVFFGILGPLLCLFLDFLWGSILNPSDESLVFYVKRAIENHYLPKHI